MTTLYVISEKQYSRTTWYNQILDGIYKAASEKQIKVFICSDDDFINLPSDSIPVLLGSSLDFISNHVSACRKRGLRPIVAGFEIYQDILQVSYVTINRQQAMADIVKMLWQHDAKKIALFGVNSSVRTDQLRIEGWKSAINGFHADNDPDDIYYADSGLDACLQRFWAQIKRYDAVACANDYYAAVICAEARRHRIKVPEELMVTGFGNTLVSQYTDPPLTTVDLNLTLVGKQTVSLFRFLLKNTDLLSSASMMKSNIVMRESIKNDITKKSDVMEVNDITPSRGFEPSYEAALRPVYSVENLLNTIDEIDFKIIKGISKGIAYETLSEKLFLSYSSFRYRLNKILKCTGCSSKKELLELFSTYIPNYFSQSL